MKSNSLGLLPNKLYSWNLNQEVLFYQLSLPFGSAQSCLTLCNPMDCSTPGFPVLRYLQSLLKFMSIESVMTSNYLVLCCPLSCPQSLPASGSFPVSQLFTSGGQSIGTLASVIPVNIQDWFPFGLTGLISLLAKGLSRVFSTTTIWMHQFFGIQLFLWSNSHLWASLVPQLVKNLSAMQETWIQSLG